MGHRFLDDRTGTLDRPTVLVDPARARRNLETMASRARKAGVRFRPHFKTHQSPDVGAWFRDAGVGAITVSSLETARCAAGDGWRDITVAFPFNLREAGDVKDLSTKVDLGMLVDGKEAVEALEEAASSDLGLWIKVDAGYGRSGLRWDRPGKIASLARTVLASKRLRLEGLLTHSGHSYRERGAAGVRRVHAESVARMNELRNELDAEGIEGLEVSVGDTPTCSLAEDFTGVDEIRPGNFVFFDLMQREIGSCGDTDLAVAVAAPVVGKHEHPHRLVLYGGAVHLSKEALRRDGRDVFGFLAFTSGRDLGVPDPAAPVVSLTQEHALVEAGENLLEEVNVGDMVLVFPVHACLACNLHRSYRTVDGEVLRRWDGV